MLKKTIALAAGLSLLTGCIASAEFANLSNILSKGTLLARSLTVSNPHDGSTKVTNFLGWISSGAPSKLERDGAQIADASKLQSNSYSDEDSATNDLNPGQTYLYALDFGGTTVSQSITPRLLPDTRLTSTAPTLTDTIEANSKPMLKWDLDGELPKGYVVTVAKMPGALGGTSLSGGEPTYIAFLDASKHRTEVAYGTPTDLAAIADDTLLSTTLSNMEGGFFAQKNEALSSGNYAWTVVAIDHDEAKTAFAIDKPDSIGFFTVQ